MATPIGGRSYLFVRPPVLRGWAAVGSKREGEGPLGGEFDAIEPDSTFGQKSWERAESFLHHKVLELAVAKAGLSYADLRAILAGDLLDQCTGSTFAVRELNVPYLGIYGACSTMAEGLFLAGFLTEGGMAPVAVSTASHFCTAERQYRFPLEYGGQRTPTSQWTATGGGAVVLGGEGGSGPVLLGGTAGAVEDLGIKDAANMGAAMAPAAAATLGRFFADTGTVPADYDLVVTGDLGAVGSELLYALTEREGLQLRGHHTDCGLLLYDRERQDVHAGGSGCGCCASVLCAHLLPALAAGELRRIVFAATGALLSPTSSQQGESIPGVCHAVCLAAGEEDSLWK